jgi:glycosyltransferase involved in cell wall biosynthesis
VSLRWSFDSVAVRDGRAFGWGWILADELPATRVELVIEPAMGVPTRITCQFGGHRQDLLDAFPAIAHAGAAGFLLQGRLPPTAEGDRAWLEARLADGRVERVEVPGFPARYTAGANAGAQMLARREMAMAMLRRGDIAGLARRGWQAAARRLNGAGKRELPKQGLAPVDVLVFDHAMGGGANQFRDRCVEGWRKEGRSVLLVTPDLPSLGYEATRIDAEGERIASFEQLEDCLRALPGAKTIVVNELVSFDDPLAVLARIGELRVQHQARVEFYLHDYFAACPSWTLVDYRHRYCGLPDLSECATCLVRNDVAFLSLLPRADMPEWREGWQRFLEAADRITAFSETSMRVLRQAYPWLDPARLQVRPHDTSHLADSPKVAPSRRAQLVVGVVGSINVSKGSEMVAEIVRIIEAEDLPLRIVAIGSIDGMAPSAALSVTGRYRPEQLPGLLERHQVSLCLLPSICHETFSYVTSELLAMGMPLASFDLGAPAERIREHPLGCIIPSVDARVAIETLLLFHGRLLQAPAPSA